MSDAELAQAKGSVRDAMRQLRQGESLMLDEAHLELLDHVAEDATVGIMLPGACRSRAGPAPSATPGSD